MVLTGPQKHSLSSFESSSLCRFGLPQMKNRTERETIATNRSARVFAAWMQPPGAEPNPVIMLAQKFKTAWPGPLDPSAACGLLITRRAELC